MLLDSDALQIERYRHRVTASFGGCEFAAGEELEFLLKQSDVALYQAKALGRNQVRVAVQTGAPGGMPGKAGVTNSHFFGLGQ